MSNSGIPPDYDLALLAVTMMGKMIADALMSATTPHAGLVVAEMLRFHTRNVNEAATIALKAGQARMGQTLEQQAAKSGRHAQQLRQAANDALEQPNEN